jgi:penicillin-binding protein 2
LRLCAIIAKDGEWVEPKLLRDPRAVSKPAGKKVAIRPEHLKVVKQGMLKVVHSDYGTGQLARVDFGQLAGKTGTAQAPPKDSHAWITAFFPYKDPQIAFVILLEHGGSGGVQAARVAKEALQIWKDVYAPGTTALG